MTGKFLSQNYAKSAAIKDESRFLGPTASDFKRLIIHFHFTLVCPQTLGFVSMFETKRRGWGLGRDENYAHCRSALALYPGSRAPEEKKPGRKKCAD